MLKFRVRKNQAMSQVYKRLDSNFHKSLVGITTRDMHIYINLQKKNLFYKDQRMVYILNFIFTNYFVPMINLVNYITICITRKRQLS